MTTIILKRLSRTFPVSPPNSNPKAIPLFSVKWIINQSNILNSCPRNIFVFIQNLRAWSTRTRVMAVESTLLKVCYWAFLASMLSVAWGTNLRRSFEMSLPVTRQIPYELFSILISAFLRLTINFAWRSASFVFSSLESVVEPSSNALNVGEVSSVPLSASFAVEALKIARSSSALSIFCRIRFLNSLSSAFVYTVFSFILLLVN